MRRLLMILLLLGSPLAASAADAATGRVVKVLPLFLDLKGHAAISPSLFDRDAYQAYLRQHTNEISAVRFDVLWSASHADKGGLKLRLELRGTGPDSLPRQTTLEKTVTPHFFRHWTSFTLGGDDLKKFGDVTSWRATLWSGDRMIGEQKSFLWRT
ncbi:MAG: hypothetical protein PHY43_14085 [Verrucomicrobiales bacterium]|nr:hypothetical protein [Verrucomicrobiales bacterium]